MAIVSEVTLTQKFHTISKGPEQYKIVLKEVWRFRYYTIEGSDWARSNECYQATEFWCFVVKRWLSHKISTGDLKRVLSTIKTSIPNRKDNGKTASHKLILLRTRDEVAREKDKEKLSIEKKNPDESDTNDK